MKNALSFSRVALIILWALFALIWVSCGNPYKKLANRPPITAKDSGALLARCIKAAPVDTGAVDFKPVLPPVPDSSPYYRGLADSLMAVKQRVRDSIIHSVNDTCAGKRVDNFDQGYKLGYDLGKYDASEKAASKYRVDMEAADSACSRAVRDAVIQQRFAYNLALNEASARMSVAEKDAKKYRNRMDAWKTGCFWTGAIAALFLIIAIILWKFRRQARAANNIINDVRDIG